VDFRVERGADARVVACIAVDGSLRWIEILGRHCCGGNPRALSDGSYVADQDCSERVVWFDRDGRVLHEREHESVLAVEPLRDGLVAVVDMGREAGSPAIIVYRPDGEPLWQRELPRIPDLSVNEDGTAFLAIYRSAPGPGENDTVEPVTVP